MIYCRKNYQKILRTIQAMLCAWETQLLCHYEIGIPRNKEITTLALKLAALVDRLQAN